MLVWQASYTWLVVEVIVFFLLFLGYKFCKKNGFFILFEMMFEKAYEFFEDILWKEEKKWIKMYIVVMFFIILFSNLMWSVLDFLHPIFWEKLEEFIKIPSSDINFNIAMAVIWVLIVIKEQFWALGFWKTLNEYFPIFWKDLIPFEKGKLPVVIDTLVFFLVKTFDIVISLFLWLLDIVGHVAKIISLSFRLFWNMTSGWMLLWMLFLWLSWLTQNLFHIDFPVVWPVILYLQWLLVALIQALVFPLLIAIFIKVAKVH